MSFSGTLNSKVTTSSISPGADAAGETAIKAAPRREKPDPPCVPFSRCPPPSPKTIDRGADAKQETETENARSGGPGLSSLQDDPNTRTQEKLGRRVKAFFEGQKLADVLSYIAKETDTDFLIKWRQIDEDADGSEPITMHLRDVQADTLLDFVLEQAAGNEVGLSIRDSVAVISSAGDAGVETSVRVFDCRDILFRELTPGERPRNEPQAEPPPVVFDRARR